jgi:hypothetical protein
MSLQVWIEEHINAFEYFERVPGLIIPDNLNEAVACVNRHESCLNKTYSTPESKFFYGQNGKNTVHPLYLKTVCNYSVTCGG